MFTGLLLFHNIACRPSWAPPTRSDTYVPRRVVSACCRPSFAIGVPLSTAGSAPRKRVLLSGFHGIGTGGNGHSGTRCPQLVNASEVGKTPSGSGIYYSYSHYGSCILGARCDAEGLVWKPESLGANLETAQGRADGGVDTEPSFISLTFGGFVALANHPPKLLVDWFHIDKRRRRGSEPQASTIMADIARPRAAGWRIRWAAARC